VQPRNTLRPYASSKPLCAEVFISGRQLSHSARPHESAIPRGTGKQHDPGVSSGSQHRIRDSVDKLE
jgi:hypothetical protein